MALNHVLAKPEKIIATALGLLEQELIVPRLIAREGIDQFKGAKDDTVNYRVEGILPFHDFAWRSGENQAGDTPSNGRQAITFDRYVERKLPIRFQGNVYSGVEIDDEQMDFDFSTWTAKILAKQVTAVGRGLGRRAVNTVMNAPYAVTIGDLGDPQSSMRGGLIEARRVLNRFQVPTSERRVLLVGTDFEAALLSDPNITLALNVGDDQADSALHEATLGRLAGFEIVVDQTIGAADAYAFVPSAYVMMTGAPSVPQSVKHGATASYDGIALRWLTDYDANHLVDRSVVNTYAGFRSVVDDLVGFNTATGQEVVTSTEQFVRGIKLTLDGPTTYPTLLQKDGTTATTWANYDPNGSGAAGTPASAELALITGVTGPGPSLTGPSATLADD